MSDVSQWDPVAANNNSAAPDGWPEGMSAGEVNDAGRELMASIRRWLEDGGWFDWNHSITFVSFSSPTFDFSISGSTLVDVYHVGRRLRVVGSVTGTLYGTITAVTYSTVTEVTVRMDSGTVSNESLAISVGFDYTGMLAGADQIQTGQKFLVIGAGVPTNGKWTLDTTYDDRIPLVQDTVGTGAAGSWTITGLSNPNTGAAGSHQHSVTVSGTTSQTSSGQTIAGSAGGNATSEHTHTFSDTANTTTEANHTHSIGNPVSDGNWRARYFLSFILEYTG